MTVGQNRHIMLQQICVPQVFPALVLTFCAQNQSIASSNQSWRSCCRAGALYSLSLVIAFPLLQASFHAAGQLLKSLQAHGIDMEDFARMHYLLNAGPQHRDGSVLMSHAGCGNQKIFESLFSSHCCSGGILGSVQFAQAGMGHFLVRVQ